MATVLGYHYRASPVSHFAMVFMVSENRLTDVHKTVMDGPSSKLPFRYTYIIVFEKKKINSIPGTVAGWRCGRVAGAAKQKIIFW